ncbi:MAG: hypothetical protein SH850_12175 [Planctomycetaceae bacterium]|nr:hypothetical protein [Planctomycetaceae bacterium]
MSFVVRGSLCALLTLAVGAGCSHFIESRAINRFAENLRDEDFDGLKDSTSTQFKERALRTASALDDMKILHLPDGKHTIVDVKEVDDHRRSVTVEVGESKKEIFYDLVKDRSGKWVVDDVQLKQKKYGVTAFKSVTEQMDLLLTVREFLDAWDSGDRDRVLTVVGPRLRAPLEQLPPSYLARLTGQVIGARSERTSFKPQAQLDEEDAVVRLPRVGGQTVLTLKLVDDQWQVRDIAVDSKNEAQQIASVWKLALAVNTCTQFLDAYQRSDKLALQPLCEADFYEGSLAIANLKQVMLPDPQIPDHDLDVQLRAQRADFVLKGAREVVQIDMHREDPAEPDAAPQFRVRDVTIYEMETKQEKRLSAMFTAQAMLDLFCEALADRDLDHLRHSSTQDLKTRVWQRLNAATVQHLPLEMFDDGRPEIVAMTFQGALTRFEARQNGQPVTYLLREEEGRFFVDDIVWQISGRPASVKQTLELLVPVRNFAAAVTLGRDASQQPAVVEMMQNTCSADFNRMVWSQTKFLPNSGLSADTFLETPLKSIVQSDTEVLIQFGTDRFGALVKLRKEYNRSLIDEVVLVAGPEQADRIEVKNTLRTLLANGTALPPSNAATQYAAQPTSPSRSRIQQAVYEEPADNPPQAIWPVGDPIDIGPIEGQTEP